MTEFDGEHAYWDEKLGRWVYPPEVADALDAAVLALDSYYNDDDRMSAIRWLLRAREANVRAREANR